jgi:chorismate mutase
VPEKTLIDVDIRIAKIRDDIAAGKATPDSRMELAALLQQRAALIDKIAKMKGEGPANST